MKKNNEPSLVGFKYHSHEDLQPFVGWEIMWINLAGKIKSGILTFESGRYWLPESGLVNACTVKTFLP